MPWRATIELGSYVETVDYRAIGPEYTTDGSESEATLAYRDHMNSQGSPTEAVAEGYVYRPGTELAALHKRAA